jgi:putative FmdB family regulatory protein
MEALGRMPVQPAGQAEFSARLGSTTKRPCSSVDKPTGEAVLFALCVHPFPPKDPLPMPTYEYRCDGCTKQFDVFQSITAEPLKTCPHCRSRKVKRLLGGGAGLLFKGSGFYITDYRSAGYQSAKKSDSAAAAPAAAGAKTEAAKPKNAAAAS